MSIKVICFDADGVVVYPQMQFSKYLKDEHNISPEMTKGFFSGVFNACLTGKANLSEVLPAFLQDWNWKGSVDEFIATWLKRDHVVDLRLIKKIQSLRQKGFICCLATSQERNRADYMKTEMGLGDVFDHLFFSCEIGWQKPDPAYYQHIETVLAVKKDSILFWDDSEKNVRAALEFGWNAERYIEFGEFEEAMKKYEMSENT